MAALGLPTFQPAQLTGYPDATNGGAKAHMIRIQHRSRTRAARTAPLFVEDCIVLRAEPRVTRPLPRSMTDLMLGTPPHAHLSVAAGSGPLAQRSVVVPVVAADQRLGGQRWWWRCPGCGRRCGILLAPRLDRPFSCRLCWRARYRSDYRKRSALGDSAWLLGELLGGGLDRDQRSLAALRAPRRRGVRRGRRVRQRAERLAGKLRRDERRMLWLCLPPEDIARLQVVEAIEEQLAQLELTTRPPAVTPGDSGVQAGTRQEPSGDGGQ